MASTAAAPELSPQDRQLIDTLRDFLLAQFDAANNIPDARILEALKNNSMDVSRAHEELCAEMERSAWDTVETKKEKKKGEKHSQSGGHQDDHSSSAPSGRGRGRGAGPGRGGGRGDFASDGTSRGGRGGADRGGRGGPPQGPSAADRGGRGGRGRGVAPRPQPTPAPVQPAAAPAAPAPAPQPVRDAPIPQNQWSKGRPRTEEIVKQPEKPMQAAAEVPQSVWGQPGAVDVAASAGGMQGMMPSASSSQGAGVGNGAPSNNASSMPQYSQAGNAEHSLAAGFANMELYPSQAKGQHADGAVQQVPQSAQAQDLSAGYSASTDVHQYANSQMANAANSGLQYGYQGAVPGATSSHVAPQSKAPVMQEQSQQSASLQAKGDQDNIGYAANVDTAQTASQMMNAANPGFQYGGYGMPMVSGAGVHMQHRGQQPHGMQEAQDSQQTPQHPNPVYASVMFPQYWNNLAVHPHQMAGQMATLYMPYAPGYGTIPSQMYNQSGFSQQQLGGNKSYNANQQGKQQQSGYTGTYPTSAAGFSQFMSSDATSTASTADFYKGQGSAAYAYPNMYGGMAAMSDGMTGFGQTGFGGMANRSTAAQSSSSMSDAMYQYNAQSNYQGNYPGGYDPENKGSWGR